MGCFGMQETADCRNETFNNCTQLGNAWWSHWDQLPSSGHLQMSG